MRRIALAAVAILLAASTAEAQEGAPAADAPDPDENARRLFGAGHAAYEEGRYADALAYFERAYELSPRPALLYNIGVAAERGGDRATALDAYRSYLEELPDASNREEVEARLEVLGRDSSDTQVAPAAPPTPAALDDSDGGTGGRLWTWVAGGLAVALGAVSAALFATASADYAELEDRCIPAGGCSDAEIDDSGIAGRATLGNVLLVGAGAALVAAAVLFFVEGGTEDETLSASPAGLRWSF